ncbi:SIT4 phosphatase-associated family protein [Trifolium repens]|nr:SIT4 phosphatase-associated family protein [Trifolium repens]
MFWRMAGLSTASPVETIMDRDNFTLEELLDEDEIIQECKALNSRLINFLSGKAHVEQLIRYIVEEAPEDAEKKRTFKFPFIACEIFTCEVDNILKTLVEDEELMNLLFSFLEPNNSHCNLLAGYFSKVVVCLMLRKTVPFMQYVQAHQEIVKKLVELIGITSIMEVLIRLIGADEHIYANHVDAMQWIENTDVLEMIVDKFSSSDSPEVHTNTAETLCAITRFAPAGLSAKISSPSFIGRLFCHALEDSRPKSVLVNSLSICISLLDPRRISFGAYHSYNRQMTNGSTVTANPETIEGMLESLGDLLKLLDVSSAEYFLPTTYGKLQPPLGKHRLKIVEFISVLLTVGSEAAEKKLIDFEAVQRIINLFFEYPYNNFLHHHVENIIVSCLESKSSSLQEHILRDCDFVGKIIQAEKHLTLEAGTNKPTSPAEGKSPPRIGSIGHLTRISNKLIQLGNTNSVIQEHLQGISEWKDWYMNVLSNRNAVENVSQWACGRPTALHDRNRDSDEDDYQDRDYDVAALANNLSQAFRYGIYNNDDDMEEVHGSLERDDEDVYFDDESAEVVISSLRLGEEPESGSLFTNSNRFAFEEDRDRLANERSTSSLASPSPNAEEGVKNVSEDVPAIEDEDLADTASSSPEAEPEAEPKLEPVGTDNKPVEWVEWRESLDASDPSEVLPNGALESESGNNDLDAAEPSPSSDVILTKDGQMDAALLASLDENLSIGSSDPIQTESENPSSPATIPLDGALAEVGDSNKDTADDKKGIEQMSS